MMATADNYVAGRMTAVAIVSPGPGVTNAATGILVAHDNCWPVVVIGGRRPLAMRGMGSFQELAAVPVFQSITKGSEVVETTAAIPEAIHRAFRTATSGRPGPVYLEIPEDVLTGVTSLFDPGSHEACEPPAHLSVRGLDETYGWRLEARLSESNGITELRFTHHLDAKTNVGDVGPGWEFYLDNLVASHFGNTMPVWDDYYPSQKAYYQESARTAQGNT